MLTDRTDEQTALPEIERLSGWHCRTEKALTDRDGRADGASGDRTGERLALLDGEVAHGQRRMSRRRSRS